VEEAQRLLVACLAEEALASPEHDREDDHSQLVHQVVLDQRAPELIAGVDEDLSVQLLLQPRDLGHHVALEHSRVAPAGMFDGRGHDVLGQAVQPVRPLAAPGQPPLGEPLVAPPTQQQGVGAQRFVELDLGPRVEVLAPELAEPAAHPEALPTVWVLDHSVERDVRADHDLSHSGSPPVALSVTDVDTATSRYRALLNRPVRPSAGVCAAGLGPASMIRQVGADDRRQFFQGELPAVHPDTVTCGQRDVARQRRDEPGGYVLRRGFLRSRRVHR
jgi:hypothetical protein